jgi:hypothetical protein
LSVKVALWWHGLLEHSLISKKIIQVTNNKWLKKRKLHEHTNEKYTYWNN